jgi:ribosomal protein S18 acetylase RimI-like enzyme
MIISNGDWIDEKMLHAAGFRKQKTNDIMIYYPTSRRQSAFRRKPVSVILKLTAVEEWTDIFTKVFFHRKSTNADYRLFRNASGIDRFAAFIGDKPVGITSFYPTRRIAQIGSVAVRSRYRRRGIATELLHHCLTRALERKMPVYLTVQEGNPSKRLYESAGFQSIGRQTYYSPMKLPMRSTRR